MLFFKSKSAKILEIEVISDSKIKGLLYAHTYEIC